MMNKAYLSILLLFVSLVINSVVSSSHIPEGFKSKKKKAAEKRKAAEQKRQTEEQKLLKKPAVQSVQTVRNIINDAISPETKVQLIKSFIAQQ